MDCHIHFYYVHGILITPVLLIVVNNLSVELFYPILLLLWCTDDGSNLQVEKRKRIEACQPPITTGQQVGYLSSYLRNCR